MIMITRFKGGWFPVGGILHMFNFTLIHSMVARNSFYLCFKPYLIIILNPLAPPDPPGHSAAPSQR
eukprot:COSAG05_NODE_44_length_25563_cov_118.074419_7_plen_66_part_00